MKHFNRSILIMAIALVAFVNTGCWVTAQEGTVQVQTIWDQITRVVRADSGGLWTITTLGDDYYEVSLKSQTTENVVQASSRDNAGLALHVAITYHLLNTDEAIINHVRKFGMSEQARNEQFTKVLIGQLNTEVKNAISEYDAYGILANQEAIQQRIADRMKPILEHQLGQELESVQIIGRPDFIDDRIEQAASQVVANQKMKEAATAGLEAAKVDAERKQVEARTYADPALLTIRKLELQREIAGEWSKHNGTLIFGNTQMVMPIEGK